MKYMASVMAFVILAVLLTACGGGSNGGSTPTTPEVLIENPSFSLPEKTSFSFDATTVIKNVGSFTFVDIDDDETTTVSADGKSFTSPDLNISIVDGNVTSSAGNILVTTTYVFGLVGTDDNNASVDTNVSIDVVDEYDDQPIQVSDINVSETVLEGEDITVRFTAFDADGFANPCMVNLYDSQANYIDGYSIYANEAGNYIDVNVSFANILSGDYTLKLIANGIVGGEGERSSWTEEVNVSVTILDTTPDDFNFYNRTGLSRNTAYNTNTISVKSITTSVTATTTDGSLYVNGVNVGTSTTVDEGDEVYVRLTTSSSYSTPVSATVTIGDKSDSFTFTTEAAPQTQTPEQECNSREGDWVWDGDSCNLL